MFPDDGSDGAAAASALFDDPRVHRFHDPERLAGRAFAPRIGMPSLREVAEAQDTTLDALEGRFRNAYLRGEAAAFDTVLFFPPGVTWEDEPPAHAGWVTQLDPATFLLDPDRFFWGEELGDEIRRLAEELLEDEAAEGADDEDR